MSNVQSYTAEEIRSYSKDIIEALKQDGAHLDSDYIIYHVVSSTSKTSDEIEKFLVAVFKAGYDAFDPEHYTKEELIEENKEEELLTYKYEIPEYGIFSTDVLVESALELDVIVEDALAIQAIAQEYNIHYQLWGTFIENGEEDDVEDPVEN